MLQGDGDSEIALVVEDGDMVKSTMDGQPFMATRFAASLRRRLFRRTSRPPLISTRSLLPKTHALTSSPLSL